MSYQSTKTFGHDLGLSVCFRQHRAQSHCKYLHGYALAIKLTFQCTELDERQWCVDFGSLKSFKDMLERTFDHTLIVAADDPLKEHLLELGDIGLAQVVEVERAGCEAFAKLIFDYAELWLRDNGYAPRCWIASVEVCEHGANSAIFTKPPAPMTVATFVAPLDPLDY